MAVLFDFNHFGNFWSTRDQQGMGKLQGGTKRGQSEGGKAKKKVEAVSTKVEAVSPPPPPR